MLSHFSYVETLCDPMDNSPPGSSVHGIIQARILEWVAIYFSSVLPNPGIEPWSPALQADSLLSEPGSYGNCMFKFFRNRHTIFHSGYTILHSSQ